MIRERSQPPVYRCYRVALSIAFAGVLTGCASAVKWESEPVSSPVPTTASSQRATRPVTAPPVAKSTANTQQEQLNTFYQTWKGVPYRFGGNSRSGIDCSALTQRAMSTLGVPLPRTTRQQLGEGVSVSGREVRAGDLVFFKTGETLNHVGVMLSKQRFLHASTSRGVTVSTLEERYWKERLTGYRRVVR